MTRPDPKLLEAARNIGPLIEKHAAEGRFATATQMLLGLPPDVPILAG